MGIATGTYDSLTGGFSLSKKFQLDARTEYDTIADMAAVKDLKMPEMLLAYCLEDHEVYLFNKTNEKDPTLGKWRKFQPEEKMFVYEKESPAKTWIINHNLGILHPRVTVFDQDGNQAIGNIAYPSENKVTVKFCEAISGVAYIQP